MITLERVTPQNAMISKTCAGALYARLWDFPERRM